MKAAAKISMLLYYPRVVLSTIPVHVTFLPPRGEMGKLTMTPELLVLVAERFKALAEPVRLQILNALRGGEMTVSALVEETALGQANVSKHLQLLHSLRFVTRRKDGLYVYYALADRSVFHLCDVMCGQLGAEVKSRRKLLAV